MLARQPHPKERCDSACSSQENTCIAAGFGEIAGLYETVFAVRQSRPNACDVFVVQCCRIWNFATQTLGIMFGLQIRTFRIVFVDWRRFEQKLNMVVVCVGSGAHFDVLFVDGCVCVCVFFFVLLGDQTCGLLLRWSRFCHSGPPSLQRTSSELPPRVLSERGLAPALQSSVTHEWKKQDLATSKEKPTSHTTVTHVVIAMTTVNGSSRMCTARC